MSLYKQLFLPVQHDVSHRVAGVTKGLTVSLTKHLPSLAMSAQLATLSFSYGPVDKYSLQTSDLYAKKTMASAKPT